MATFSLVHGAWGLGLQITFAIFVLRVDFGRRIFQHAGHAMIVFRCHDHDTIAGGDRLSKAQHRGGRSRDGNYYGPITLQSTGVTPR